VPFEPAKRRYIQMRGHSFRADRLDLRIVDDNGTLRVEGQIAIAAQLPSGHRARWVASAGQLTAPYDQSAPDVWV
jgi:hypothetical protein